MIKQIFFITGASGTGKTSLVSDLKNKFKNKENWVFLHFDSIGVLSPQEMAKQFGSKENWQKQNTFHMKDWLNFLRQQANELGAKIIGTSNLSKSDVLKSFEEILEKNDII